jgi:hypothetical protein
MSSRYLGVGNFFERVQVNPRLQMHPRMVSAWDEILINAGD